MQKFLITGLGNKGVCYENTRHNIGFKVLDHLAQKHVTNFSSDRFGEVSRLHYRGKLFLLLKPDTFMNLSGKAVKYWMNRENLSIDQLLVITDDIHLELGALRLRSKGSDGGHNGLKNIQELLSTPRYPRLRIGVGKEFEKGKQVDYVLGTWTQKELSALAEPIENAVEAIISFGMKGLHITMNIFNGIL